jgi:hypothetical protein
MAKSPSGGKPPSKPPPRQTSPEISSLAARIMNGSLTPTSAQMRRVAASVVSQDQTPGQKPKVR